MTSARGKLSRAEERDIEGGMWTARDRAHEDAVAFRESKKAASKDQIEALCGLPDEPAASLLTLHEDRSSGGKGGGLRGAMRPGKRVVGLSWALASYVDGIGQTDDELVASDLAREQRDVEWFADKKDKGSQVTDEALAVLRRHRPEFAECVELYCRSDRTHEEIASEVGLKGESGVRWRIDKGLHLMRLWRDGVTAVTS